MHWIAGTFRCIEPEGSWQLPLPSPSRAPERMVLLDYPTLGAAPVKQILTAILCAQANNCPVILRRDPDTPLPTSLPEHFCIGLQTSGTTGAPKLVFHALERLLPPKPFSADARWLLSYHPMSFAGLQVILQAAFSGAMLISAAQASAAEKAALAVKHAVTALGVTPSLFRAMTLIWQQNLPPLTELTFGGEICDDVTLQLAADLFPSARIRHIYATTETGVLLSVRDGKAGFPAGWLGKPLIDGKRLSLEQGMLWAETIKGRLNTGDRAEIIDDRVCFRGRYDNIANVGGTKVDLDALEQAFLTLEHVIDVRVFARNNPITGHLVCMEFIAQNETLARNEINQYSQTLVAEMRPRLIRCVPQITLTDAGKKQRINP